MSNTLGEICVDLVIERIKKDLSEFSYAIAQLSINERDMRQIAADRISRVLNDVEILSALCLPGN
jgi:hypothetical protein